MDYRSASSDTGVILSGVPHDSILGPLLFVLFVNDLPKTINNCSILMYADDTVIFCAGKNTKDIEQKLNDDPAFIDSWLTINSLFLHKDKTESVLFGSNGKLSKVDSFKIRVGDQVLKRVLEFKYLGVVFDENLSWNAHIKYIATKASKRIGLLKRTRKDLCAYSTNLAYTSFVRPVLEYCDSVWSCCGKGNIDQLEKLQRRSARIVMRSHSSDQA